MVGSGSGGDGDRSDADVNAGSGAAGASAEGDSLFIACCARISDVAIDSDSGPDDEDDEDDEIEARTLAPIAFCAGNASDGVRMPGEVDERRCRVG